MTFPNRKFGVEIEFIGNINIAQEALEALGVECVYEHENTKQTYSKWKFTQEASVHRGGELVSPVLSGVDGFRQIEIACQALQQAECSVNNSCGLHVHVDGSDLSVKEAVNLLRRYADSEQRIDTVMPRKRRESHNQWSQSLRILDAQKYEQMLQQSDISNVGYLVPGGKYNKVNLASYSRQKTIEFRHHSGTLSADKIINWVRFCVNFLENSKETDYEATERLQPEPLNQEEEMFRQRLVRNCCGERRLYNDAHREQYSLTQEQFRNRINRLRDVGWEVFSRDEYDQYDRLRVYHYITCGYTRPTLSPRLVTVRSNGHGFNPEARDNPFYGLDQETVGYFDERACDFG